MGIGKGQRKNKRKSLPSLMASAAQYLDRLLVSLNLSDNVPSEVRASGGVEAERSSGGGVGAGGKRCHGALG
jgi:hypothetical protein